MGLKTIVKEELARRGLTWNRKAPRAVPNRKEAARLAVRQAGHTSIISGLKGKVSQEAFTMPGSYRK